MNVNDLYYHLTSNCRHDNFSFILDSPHKIIGFLECSKDFIPAVIPDNVFTDIITNNTIYQKCVYVTGYKNFLSGYKNALSGLISIETDTTQLILHPFKINDTLYYRAPYMLLDNNFNILLSICYDFNHNHKLVVSPKIYCDKTTVNKYILQKVVPVFVNKYNEVTIKEVKIDVINSIEEDYIDKLKNMDNAYELVKMGN